jgi:Zn-dependent peptidase ImmA (M78 family)
MNDQQTNMDRLLEACEREGINFEELPLYITLKGIYFKRKNTRPVIALSKALEATADITCVLAEELGHHYTSQGNLLTGKKTSRATVRKQETRARNWAINEILSLTKIIEAFEKGYRDRYEIAEYLGVTVEFLTEAFDLYAKKYGISKRIGDYIVFFDPPSVYKILGGD